ncbi:hypothetical protein HK102_010650, partial [Quaeritorhiza haematococci]
MTPPTLPLLILALVFSPLTLTSASAAPQQPPQQQPSACVQSCVNQAVINGNTIDPCRNPRQVERFAQCVAGTGGTGERPCEDAAV